MWPSVHAGIAHRVLLRRARCPELRPLHASLNHGGSRGLEGDSGCRDCGGALCRDLSYFHAAPVHTAHIWSMQRSGPADSQVRTVRQTARAKQLD